MLGEMRRKHCQQKKWLFYHCEYLLNMRDEEDKAEGREEVKRKGEGKGRKGKENENLRDTLYACEHI